MGVEKTMLPVELVIVNPTVLLSLSDAATQTRSPTSAFVETYRLPCEFESTDAQSQLGQAPLAVSVMVKVELPCGLERAAHVERLTDWDRLVELVTVGLVSPDELVDTTSAGPPGFIIEK